MLRVLQVAFPFAPVGLDSAGGAEQVMALLDRALVARGHESISIARTGSRTAGRLLEVSVGGSFHLESQRLAREAFRRRIVEALDESQVDVIHMHGLDFESYLPPAGIPVLATLHLPVSYYAASTFRLSRPRTYLNCVSESQRRGCPPCDKLLEPIQNGIPLDLFPEKPIEKQNYAFALGRICPEKGFHLALQAAERAGVPLWIGGMVYPFPEHERYFDRELLPRIVQPHRFLGPVDFARKIELLGAARCLVVPSLVPETGSLVAMEAMACGTPVVGFSSGALTDLIDNGRTGILAGNVDEMAAGIARSGQLDGIECRAVAHRRFSAADMADRYIATYRRIASASCVCA